MAPVGLHFFNTPATENAVPGVVRQGAADVDKSVMANLGILASPLQHDNGDTRKAREHYHHTSITIQSYESTNIVEARDGPRPGRPDRPG